MNIAVGSSSPSKQCLPFKTPQKCFPFLDPKGYPLKSHQSDVHQIIKAELNRNGDKLKFNKNSFRNTRRRKINLI